MLRWYWRLFTVAALTVLIAGCASAPGARGELVYLALGASDAVGIGAIPLRRGYVFRIRDALDDSGVRVDLVNLGIPGGDVDDIRRAARLGQFTAPRLVTLWTGANDLINGDDVEDFEDALGALLGDLRRQTRAQIVIGDLPDLTRIPRFINDPSRVVTEARVAAFNAAIVRQAERNDARIARLSSLDMLEELTSDIDGFHPNNRGHLMIAERFLEEIRKTDLLR